MDWFYMAHNTVEQQGLVNTEMKFRDP